MELRSLQPGRRSSEYQQKLKSIVLSLSDDATGSIRQGRVELLHSSEVDFGTLKADHSVLQAEHATLQRRSQIAQEVITTMEAEIGRLQKELEATVNFLTMVTGQMDQGAFTIDTAIHR
jgi:hypothetical protein